VEGVEKRCVLLPGRAASGRPESHKGIQEKEEVRKETQKAARRRERVPPASRAAVTQVTKQAGVSNLHKHTHGDGRGRPTNST
jgi:hypothetical protein